MSESLNTLNVAERIMLLHLLPAQGNIITLRVALELQQAIAFSEDELIEASIVQEDEQMRWDPEADLVKEVAVGPAARGLIVEVLKKLDAEQKLTANHITLYERFVEQGN